MGSLTFDSCSLLFVDRPCVAFLEESLRKRFLNRPKTITYVMLAERIFSAKCEG